MNSALPFEPEHRTRFDQLLAAANRQYEADDYPAAIRDYRAAALIGPLDSIALDCLASAEEHEPIFIRRRLSALWPDSIDHALAEVQTWVRAGHLSRAVKRFTELLGRGDLTPGQIRVIRCGRLDAARRCDQPDEFAADFLFIWRVSEGERTHRGVRLALIRRLAEIVSPRLLGALLTIRDTLADDPELTRISASKFDQLAILANLEAARTRERIERRVLLSGADRPGSGPPGD